MLAERRPPYVVLDPVMVATSGDRLLAADAVARLRDVLLPHVDLITPNLPEAADLLGVPEAHDEAAMREQLDSLRKLAPGVLLKGGHLGGAESPDLFAAPSRGADGPAEPTRLVARRIETTNDHGTGCTLSSAIAALRPQRDSWLAAVTDAKAYLTRRARRRRPPRRRRRPRPGPPLPLLVVTSAWCSEPEVASSPALRKRRSDHPPLRIPSVTAAPTMPCRSEGLHLSTHRHHDV